MISEQDIAGRLERGLIDFPPLKLDWSARWTEGDSSAAPDAIIWVQWGGQRQKFAVEFKAISTPRVVRDAMYQAKAAAQQRKMLPMIIVPYLKEEALLQLERDGVSGVDLCGNGIVFVPGKFSVYRTGNRNQFTSSAPIKNVYRRNSSMVSRLLLVQPRFNRVSDILAEVNRRNILGTWARDPMSLPTVSKVLKTLTDDLVVARDGYSTRLLQAEKLLDALRENYAPPTITEVVNWEIPMPSQGMFSLNEALGEAFKSDIPAVVSGTSAGTISSYAVMQGGGTQSIYCPDPEKWLAKVPGKRVDRFATLSVLKTEDASAYFDARRANGLVFASPIQAYLELMAGDKRDQETALQVKDYIIGQLKEAKS